jgi:hypothetical protein
MENLVADLSDGSEIRDAHQTVSGSFNAGKERRV